MADYTLLVEASSWLFCLLILLGALALRHGCLVRHRALSGAGALLLGFATLGRAVLALTPVS